MGFRHAVPGRRSAARFKTLAHYQVTEKLGAGGMGEMEWFDEVRRRVAAGAAQ